MIWDENKYCECRLVDSWRCGTFSRGCFQQPCVIILKAANYSRDRPMSKYILVVSIETKIGVKEMWLYVGWNGVQPHHSTVIEEQCECMCLRLGFSKQGFMPCKAQYNKKPGKHSELLLHWLNCSISHFVLNYLLMFPLICLPWSSLVLCVLAGFIAAAEIHNLWFLWQDQGWVSIPPSTVPQVQTKNTHMHTGSQIETQRGNGYMAQPDNCSCF